MQTIHCPYGHRALAQEVQFSIQAQTDLPKHLSIYLNLTLMMNME